MQNNMENKSSSPKPEIMAPAGSMAAFQAAISAGADAVYLGLPYFNARRPAKNFSQDELKTAIGEAHQQGVKVFITLNIDLKSTELPLLLRVLQLISDLKADAVIVKDWAVFYLVQKYYPALEIHLSTQMGLANSLAAVKSKELGAGRVVLARELQLAELENFTGAQMPEIEIFAQGSMCFSVSGKCLLSSWVGGRSANRGGCLAPCRVAYQKEGGEESEPCFSMKDLSIVKRLNELKKVPLAALKIEGRLKNPGWVFEMVKAYKQALNGEDVSEIEGRLKRFSGRELTDGYLFTNQELTAGQNQAYGVCVGKVISVDDGQITVDFNKKQPNTALRLFNNGFAGMLYNLPEEFNSDSAGNGLITTDLTPEPGTLVYEVGINEATATDSKIGQYGFDLKLVQLNEQSARLTIITDEGEEVQEIKLKQVVHAERGIRMSSLPEKLQGKFYHGRALNKFILEEDFFVARSQLNNLPDTIGQAMAKLQNRYQLKNLKAANPVINEELRSFKPEKGKPNNQYRANRLRVRASDLDQILKCDQKITAQSLIVDLIEISDIAKIVQVNQIVPITAALFPVLFENQLEIEKELVAKLYAAGIRYFEINDLAHLKIMENYAGVKLSAGTGYAAYNYLAADFIGGLGVNSVMAPYEMDQEALQDLCNLSNIPVTLTLLSRVPLFYSRANNPLYKNGQSFTDQLGNTLRVVDYRDLHIFYSEEFFYAGSILEKNIRLKNIVADLGGEESIVPKFNKLLKGECPVISRPFNLERKLY